MYEVSFGSYESVGKIRAAQSEIRHLKTQLAALKNGAGQGAVADAISALDKKVTALEGAGGGGFRGGGGGGGASGAEPSFARLNGEFNSLMALVEGADVQPTTQALAAFAEAQKNLAALFARWREIKDQDVKSLNEQLRQANLPTINR
jgi:hypothetical protein